MKSQRDPFVHDQLLFPNLLISVDDASKPECRPVQELQIVDTLKGAIKEDANSAVPCKSYRSLIH